MARTLWRLSTAALLLLGALLILGQPISAQEKDKDKGSVFEDLLDTLRKNNQITPEQQKELQERARREMQGQPLAGIDENLKPYLRSPDGNFRLDFKPADYGDLIVDLEFFPPSGSGCIGYVQHGLHLPTLDFDTGARFIAAWDLPKR